jgi:hypothetical protein
MLQQSNNTVEIDKTGYTLASLCLALQSNLQIALCVVAVNHILKTIGWLNLHPYLQGFVLPDLREVNTTGVNLQHQVFSHQKAVYSEDLPKMDFVAPPVKKQILEGKDVNLSSTLDQFIRMLCSVMAVAALAENIL